MNSAEDDTDGNEIRYREGQGLMSFQAFARFPPVGDDPPYRHDRVDTVPALPGPDCQGGTAAATVTTHSTSRGRHWNGPRPGRHRRDVR